MTNLHRILTRSSATGALAIALTMGASVAHAQTAAASDQTAVAPANDATDPGDIVVTAQKRAERLQDVPLAVTAISGDALAGRQINDTTALVKAVPSLTFQQGNHPANTTFRVRGVGTALFGQGVESSVAVVVDGVPLVRQAQALSDLADIERIEVLRGPQGTLFGKNASAGLISVITARPSSHLEGSGDVTIAERGEYRVKGTVSGPLSDTVRARLSGFYNDVEGPAYNVTLKHRVNGQSAWGVRGKLDWDAADNLNFLLSAEYRKTKSDCCIYASIKTVNPIFAQLEAPVVASPTNRLVAEDTPNRADSNQTTVSLQADWDLGPATITSITAYQDYHLIVNQPIDRLNSDPVRYVGTSAYASWNFNQGIVDLNQFSQELRIASNGKSDLTYVAGVFYSHGDVKRPFARRRAVCASGTVGQVCAAPTYQSSSSFAELKTDNIAAFGQLEYRIVGGLKAIAGLRVQHERGDNFGRQLGVTNVGDTLLPGVPNTTGRLKDNDTAVTGKAGLQYEFHRDLQAYATYTRGYKGLGYNMEAATDFANQTDLRPERVNAYEVGMKGRAAGGMLSYALAIYRADYTNLQVQANRSDPITGVVSFVPTNAGKSRSQGVELETTLRPSDKLSITASVSYTDSTINIDGLNCPLQFQAAAPTLSGNFPVNSCYRASTTVNGVTTVSGPRQDLRDAPLPASPKWRITFAPRQDFDLSDNLGGFLQVAVNYQSSQHFAIEQDPLLVQKAYAMVDASVGVYTIDRKYNLSLFVKNLFDQNYYSAMAHNSLLATAANPNDIVATFNKDADRYFGATLGVRF
jgi:iron complex outermembrane receptor protein